MPELVQQAQARGNLRVEAAYGRLYVSGPDAAVSRVLPGAVFHQQRHVYELSLTLDTLRALARAAGLTRAQLAQRCAPEVLAWARAAKASEERVAALHARLATGWRLDMPWQDMAGSGRAPYDHQRIMASAAASLDGVAFLAEMGTG